MFCGVTQFDCVCCIFAVLISGACFLDAWFGVVCVCFGVWVLVRGMDLLYVVTCCGLLWVRCCLGSGF